MRHTNAYGKPLREMSMRRQMARMTFICVKYLYTSCIYTCVYRCHISCREHVHSAHKGIEADLVAVADRLQDIPHTWAGQATYVRFVCQLLCVWRDSITIAPHFGDILIDSPQANGMHVDTCMHPWGIDCRRRYGRGSSRRQSRLSTCQPAQQYGSTARTLSLATAGAGACSNNTVVD